MNNRLKVLFALRLFFYYSVIVLILLHPGISVSFDRIGALQWFVIIPLQALLAFLPAHKGNLRNKFIFAAVSLFALSVIAGGFGPGAFKPFFTGLISFILTFLLFYYPRWAKIAALEPFFLAWICLRLLALSRSGEDIAGQAIMLTQFILVWTGVVFLFHSVVVYLCLFPQSSVKAWKEGAAFSLSAFAVLIILLVALPPDFVRNKIIENLKPDRMPETVRSDSEKGLPRQSGRRTLPRGDRGQKPELRGIREHNWPGRGGGAEDSRQYMVMVVASDREPVYMGSSFRGQLDSAEGFLPSPQEQLNSVVNQRFFVTWFNNERELDLDREQREIFSLSTLQQKYLPWRPVSIDPTILNENSGPLRYIHKVVSNTHIGDPLWLVNTPSRPFTKNEINALAPYLELPLEENDIEEFSVYLNNALNKWQEKRESIINGDRHLREIFAEDTELETDENEYLEKIIALLVNFSEYQYTLSINDDGSIEALKQFLFISKEGDCVEFSNSLALLGRLAGIPSRVVTGYLAAEGLQTAAHLRGLALLRSKIPVLQEFPFENLFMVTNLHSHSWAQFYIPDYGWLDFEATSFAQPPVGMGDFNNWDVVIPLIDDDRTFSQIRKFPWQAVFRAAVTLLIFALICAYALRYGRELVLYLGIKRGGRAGARSLYLYLLARLAADGQPIKPVSKTANEYADLFPGAEENPHFKTFASLYSRLRWREFSNQTESDECFLRLTNEYRSILKTTRRKGIHRWFIRLISLRGLAYL